MSYFESVLPNFKELFFILSLLSGIGVFISLITIIFFEECGEFPFKKWTFPLIFFILFFLFSILWALIPDTSQKFSRSYSEESYIIKTYPTLEKTQ